MAATVTLIRGDGTRYDPNNVNVLESTGTAAMHVTGATSRTNAISAALTAYPTHPDDNTLPAQNRTANFVGFDSANTQVWHVDVTYGHTHGQATGLIGESFHGQNYTDNDRHRASSTYRDMGTTLAAAVAARATGTGPNGEPLEGYDSYVVDKTELGDTVVSRVDYAYPSFQPVAHSESLTKAFHMPVANGVSLETSLGYDTATEITSLSDSKGKILVHQVRIPEEEFRVFWKSNSSVQSAMDASIGTLNSSAYTINGRTLATKTAMLATVDEIDFGSSASPRYHSTIVFTVRANPKWWYSQTFFRKSDGKVYCQTTKSLDDTATSFPPPPTYIP